MDKQKILSLLQKVADQTCSVDEALETLRHLPYEDLGFARVDHHRALRGGVPEVIFCQGKKISDITAIFERLWAHNTSVLLTRANEEIFTAVRGCAGEAIYNERARTIAVCKEPPAQKEQVAVISAGTADTDVAEEAAVTLEVFGSKVIRIYDAGVAGLHRLVDHLDQINKSNCVVVVAGMDGALPSVIGGLVACPVIAVPTSVGYGAHFDGLAALLTMLNSCAPGVTVVNIDNGFGAGYVAGLINRNALLG